jgi:hypothetical protein
MLIHNAPTVVTEDYRDVNSTGNFIHPIAVLITTYLKYIRIFLRYWIDFLIIRLSDFELAMPIFLAASRKVKNNF